MREPVVPLHSLTGFRFLPALAVVVYHFGRRALPEGGLLRRFLDGGYVGVGAFFVLSGFVLVHAYGSEPFTTWRARRVFWAARIARVYPVYLLSLVIAFAEDTPSALRVLSAPGGWMKGVLVVTLLNAWSHHGMFFLNWAAWSLSVEVFFYALFPFVAPRLAARSTRALLGLGALAYAIGYAVPIAYMMMNPDHLAPPRFQPDQELWSWYLKFFPLCRLHEFLIGVIAGTLWRHHRPSIEAFVARRADLLIGGGLLAAFALTAASSFVPFPIHHNALLSVLIAGLVIALATGKGQIAHVLAAWPFERLGRASYALYILQLPLVYSARRATGLRLSTPIEAACLVLYLLVASLLVHAIVEEPARRAVNRLLVGRPPSA